MNHVEGQNFEQVQATNKLLLEMVKNQRDNTKNITRLFIITVVCYTVLLISMIAGFFWYESQFVYTEEVVTEEVITQEVSGDDAEINNVEGNMYNDNAIHNENGGAE